MGSAKRDIDGNGYHKTTLKNGLRVVTEKLPSVRSISLGIWIDVGSRDEQPHENGLSHFIEHMFFKGTKKRNAKQIASELESIGGSINAFTSREQTCFVARILDEQLEIAIDVLSDITTNSLLTPVNLMREKMVICEEIKESIETPSDHIHDLFAKTYWQDHPLGQPIMGYIETISTIPRKLVLDFIKRNYRNSKIVIAASGSISHDKLVRMVLKKFNFNDGPPNEMVQAVEFNEKRVGLKENGNDQTHISIGYPGLCYADKDKITALALNAYLGGGMSSVLFQKIREEKGLAYTVYCYHDLFRDSGIFNIYMATDKSSVSQALEIVDKELDKVKRKKLSSHLVDQLRSQLKGQLTLGLESTTNRMNRIARQELMGQPYSPLRKVLKNIDGITTRGINEMANRIFDSNKLALAVLGSCDKNVIDIFKK